MASGLPFVYRLNVQFLVVLIVTFKLPSLLLNPNYFAFLYCTFAASIKLKKAIEHALEAQALITDEASALEFVGEKVQVVQGRSDNIKITYPDDLELARLILAAQ